jgi:hypothetical protein
VRGQAPGRPDPSAGREEGRGGTTTRGAASGLGLGRRGRPRAATEEVGGS